MQGWVHRLYRSPGGDVHLVLRDRSGLIQAVLPGTGPDPSHPEWPDLQREAVVAVTGTARCHHLALNSIEIAAERVEVLSRPTRDLPLDISRPDLLPDPELLLANRILALRHPRLQAIFRIQDEIVASLRGFLYDQGFLELRTPKIGRGSRFNLPYFEQDVCLAQGSQLCKHLLIAAGFERVFEVGPAFRPGESACDRYLDEFTTIDAAIAFVGGLSGLMDLVEGALRYTFRRLADRATRDLVLLDARLPVAGSSFGKIPRLTFHEAREVLAGYYGHAVSDSAEGLAPAEEALLSAHVRETTGSDLFFVSHFPAGGQPFYARRLPADPPLALTFDVILRGQGIGSGGDWTNSYDEVLAAMGRSGLDPSRLDFLLETHRYGMPPHGGFTLGAERLTARLLDLGDIRLASAFPFTRGWAVL